MTIGGRAMRYVNFSMTGVALALVACSVPVAGNLDEADANQAVALLARGGVGADKERDPEHEGHFRVSVAKGEASTAIGFLAEENLPPKSSPGVLEALGQGGVVPSRLAEHARWTAGVAGDLERSLRSLEGVLSARVHLAVPARDGLNAEETPGKPSASVLVRHRGAVPPVAVGEVQRLVAGAVPGLSPEQVNVVLATTPAGRASTPDLARFGPLTVTQGSAMALRALAAGIVLLNLALLAGILLLWSRLRRSEQALAEVRAEGELQRRK
jgi:type III secretion protein J